MRFQGLFSPPLTSPSTPPSLSLFDASVMDLNDLSTNITNTLAEKPSVATLATILLSFTGFQDWLKLFLIGGIFETCRRFVFEAWHNIVDSFWVTVDFEDGDQSYGGCLHLSFALVSKLDHRRNVVRRQVLTVDYLQTG